MSYFEFPHTRSYDGDLGFIIKRLEELTDAYNNFFEYNTIKFHDPIYWVISESYPANNIVYDEQTETFYISKQATPAGIDISNTDYWLFLSPFKTDTVLSATSLNPIANKPVTVKFNLLTDSVDSLNTRLAAEIAARLESEQTINTRIDAAAGSITTETNARINADNVLSGRIDEIIEGASVDPDAELLDIRVGANAITYSSAGDAVREQFDAVNPFIITLSDFTIERGAYGATGNYDNSNPNYRLRTDKAIEVKQGDYFISNPASNVTFAVIFSDSVLSSVSDSGWIADGNTWTAASDGFARITIKKTNNTIIADDEITTLAGNIKAYMTAYNRNVPVNIADIKTTAENNKDGFIMFDPSIFQLGGINAGVINNNYARIVTTNIQSFDYDITIVCDSGYNFGLNFYDASEEYTTSTTWITSYTVEARTKFRMVVRKNPDYAQDYKLMAALPALSNHVKYTSVIGSKVNALTKAVFSNYDYKYEGDAINTQVKGFSATQLYSMPANPAGKSSQGLAIYNNVLFQLYNADYVKLLDMSDFSLIGEYEITCDHGDTAEFSNEFYDPSDDFPLLYITSDTTPAKVYVNRVTTSGATLIKTIYFGDTSKTGYYAGHCIDKQSNIMYLVGYTNNSYYQNPDNTNNMIVSSWNLNNMTENLDGTFTPEFIESFTVPFITTAQGQRFFDNKIMILSSGNGAGDIPTDTKIVCIDPFKKKICTVFDNFPPYIKSHEGEGIEFILNSSGTAYDMVLSCSYYWRIKF